MIEYIFYFVGLMFSIFIFTYIIFKLRNPFWGILPINHKYSLFKNRGIIEQTFPKKNKFVNCKDICSYNINKISKNTMNKIFEIYKIHQLYFNQKTNLNLSNLFAYFIGNNTISYISVYNKQKMLYDTNNGNIIKIDAPTGFITSRPITIIINNDASNKEKVPIYAYFIDNLCVEFQSKKEEIEFQLIATHFYNQRILNKNIYVSLFWRETLLSNVVPMCKHKSYLFKSNNWTKPIGLSAEYKLIDINQTNLRFLHDFIIDNLHRFNSVILTEITNIIELINTKNIFITAIVCDNKIICCYFFRKNGAHTDNMIEILNCFSSISNCERNIFIQGFKISFWNIASNNNIGACELFDFSQNDEIIQNLKEKTEPYSVQTSAFYFYNFTYTSFEPAKMFLLF